MAQTPKPKTLIEISKQSPTTEEIDALLSEIDTHNHRASAVLGGAFVEDALESAIQKRFIVLGKTKTDKLFDYPGPLSSFDAKIRVGYAIGLYGQIIHNDLDVIRHIRNAFAHAKKPISFDTQEVINELQKSKYLQWRDANQNSDAYASIVRTTRMHDSQYRHWWAVLTKLLANELFVLARNNKIRLWFISDLP
jgi:DNA-binding MltR family transcriptional regulator